MKNKTLIKIRNYMESGQIFFSESGFVVIRLTNGEICDIIQCEYGIRPKKRRIVKKKLSEIVKNILDIVIKHIEIHGE
ncbi:MAG: hypothetical protein R3321_15410 [Nitrososphaeraceae archaeon]|nr:hypothetical protein [Nitrososphaeraceae archaeon]